MHKYIGRTVDIIYLDRRGQISRRRIRIRSVQDGMIRAYDMDRRGPRIFRMDNILAIQPAMSA